MKNENSTGDNNKNSGMSGQDPEQSITHNCFGLRGKNVLLAAKACITAVVKQMGLSPAYLPPIVQTLVERDMACPDDSRLSV
jgi:hypothetical protein